MQQKMMRFLSIKERTLGNTLSRIGRYWWHVWRRTPLHHPRKLIPYIATLLLLLAMLPGPDVRASIRMSHIEWLATEISTVKGLDLQPWDYALKKGDVSSSVLQTMDFTYQDVLAMDAASRHVFSFKKMRAGHRIQRKNQGVFTRVWYDVDAKQRLQLEKEGDSAWQASLLPRPLLRFKQHTHGIIEGSLFVAATKAGMDERTTMALIDVFAWDIDFARNLRKGDRFDVYYEEAYDNRGTLVSTSILAAQFINRGKSYTAVRYTDSDGKQSYYDALSGSNLKKDFLKSPVKYSRISSRFSHARKHPILGYTRAHKGVDYAARSGTPIHAVADGVIKEAGRHGGYGRYVRINHRNGINTRYGHLRRYGKGIHRGVHVHQGQVIGYVGMSGLATGPHLHFEYRHGNKAINPLHVRREAGAPIAKKEMPRFKQATKSAFQSLQYYAVQQQNEQWG
ncbi:MAG: peptidoglycan DD-metalloendopeptidase family protein [Mariprofundaceae bacterium]|nr:peptidoglycan DD-metalloendopeptidase family protein [Mariprofundaceae bacterium]